VIDAAVNNTLLDSNAYRMLEVKPVTGTEMPGEGPGTAALLQVGKAYKVLVFSPAGATGWWFRFYDAEVMLPPTSRPEGGANEPIRK
jgi:hypothetical protein